MSSADLAQWLQAIAVVAGLVGTVLAYMLTQIRQDIRDNRAEADAARTRLHAHIGSVADASVPRREYDAAINNIAHALEEQTQSINHLSLQLDHIQDETASARIELLKHRADDHGAVH